MRIAIICLLFASCSSYYQPSTVNYYDYRISTFRATDSSMIRLLKPYSDSVNKLMNSVIATLASPLEKKQPNGSMGLVFVDALRTMAAQYYNKPVDAAFINNGGLRVPSLPAGALTIGKIYEVMPFDNLVMIQTVKGSVLKEFLDLIARKGGWPVSGVQFQIVNNKAEQIFINGKELIESTEYVIANSDYIVNGGDDCEMLKKLPRESKNILMRDAFIEYFKKKTAEGIIIEAIDEPRVIKK
jgi:2',3'-cyclic-nucleotide 2'-phosphodiesterase (5'-nucleotidase family)